MQDKDLSNLISFWDSGLLSRKGLYSPAIVALIELTVKALRELQALSVKTK